MAEAATEKKSAFKKTIQDETSLEKLGDLLRKNGQITRSQLKEAEEISKKSGKRITKVLIELGYIDEDSLINFVTRNLQIPFFDIDAEKIDPEAVKRITWEIARDNLSLPVAITGDTITIAMLDPTNFKSIEAVTNETKLAVKTFITREKQLYDSFRKYYSITDEDYAKLLGSGDQKKEEDASPAVDVESLDIGGMISDAAEGMEVEGGEDLESSEEGQLYNPQDAAIVKLANSIFLKAINQGVSDIHIEPYEKLFQVRYRLDGVLYRSINLPLSIKNALISRIKIMASLNIAEKRKPQDGRIKIKLGRNRAVDFRVSVLPTLFGESVVMRLLDKEKLKVDLTMLGFSKDAFATFKKAIEFPQGLILVTGPTGSGKTNTLYSGINFLNRPEVKILTAEDPVEFNFAGINQVNVRPEVGMTFAAALKAFLRQDPEIILVGEIRDMETAEIAVKAAMTGHLVFSTLHTNDCPSTINRLIDIGVPGYMIGSSLILVVAQRLLRKICAKCREQVPKLNPKELLEAGFTKEELPEVKVFRGAGCGVCSGTGYKGRLGCFEVLMMTEPLKQAITAQVPEDQLRKIAIKEGMITLRRDGLNKVCDGLTTLEEVLGKTVLVKEALPAYLLNPDELIFEDGDLIIKEGNTDKNFYQLMQGCVIIIKNGRIVGEISQPSEYFGEMSALLDQPRVATIKAKGKCVVKVFPGDKLQETIENHPPIALKIIRSLMNRVSEADKKLSRLAERKF